MNTNQADTNRSRPARGPYALRREGYYWQLTFEGRRAVFKHELGALYVAYLLLEPPCEPMHGVALALNARVRLAQPAGPGEALQQRVMGLEDAASVRALWRRQRELERVLADRLEIEPVKAEAQRELEEITEHLRQSPWLSRHGAERCARAVGAAINRLHARLAGAVDAEGRPNGVLRAFALHLHEYLLLLSGRGDSSARKQAMPGYAGCFIYVPPRGVGWEVQSLKSKVQSLESKVQSPESEVQSPGSKVQGPESKVPHPPLHRPATVGYLSRFLCAGFVLAFLVAGCAGSRPLKGGKAVISRKPGGVVEQTLVQSENPAQATKQDQESVKVRSYTVPAGSRVETSLAPSAVTSAATPRPPHPAPLPLGGGEGGRRPGEVVQEASTAYILSAPMPVVEREESRARTELGAAQKDTARELGARLASLKGIVWVGIGLFVFGLASLVWPPLKVVIASVTTSAALMLGGLALMVLPSLIVGNELLILGVVTLAVGGWFLAHRHGEMRGSLKSKV